MSAILSHCGRYRYRLDRSVGFDGPVFAYFGVNPSTADAQLDDATVRKWTGFTKVFGGSRFIVGNLFAYRSTDVRALGAVKDPVGPLNEFHWDLICSEADILVPCFGSTLKLQRELRPQAELLISKLKSTGKPLMTFGLTKDLSPKHPLMLGYDTKLVEFCQSLE